MISKYIYIYVIIYIYMYVCINGLLDPNISIHHIVSDIFIPAPV